MDYKNPKNDTGTNPYHFAAINGHLEMCKLILGFTVNKNPRNSVGFTPYHLAAKIGNLNICELFVDYTHQGHR